MGTNEATKEIELTRRPLLETKWCQALIGMMLDFRLERDELTVELAAAKAEKIEIHIDHSEGTDYTGVVEGVRCPDGVFQVTDIKTHPTPPPAEGDTFAEDLARRFHNVYENCAPRFGYETKDETKEFDPTSSNGKLMIHVCGVVGRALVDGLTARVAELEGKINEKYWEGIRADNLKLNTTIDDLRQQLGTEKLHHRATTEDWDNQRDAVIAAERERDAAKLNAKASAATAEVLARDVRGLKKKLTATTADTAIVDRLEQSQDVTYMPGINGTINFIEWSFIDPSNDKIRTLREAATAAGEQWTDSDKEAVNVLVDVGLVKPAPTAGEQADATASEECFVCGEPLEHIDGSNWKCNNEHCGNSPSSAPQPATVEERIEAAECGLEFYDIGNRDLSWSFEGDDSTHRTVLEALAAIEQIQADATGGAS